MNPSRRRFLELTAGAVLLPTLSQTASAQAYPSRPVTIIVPFGAGGPSDTIARILADGMKAPMGQPVIVENVPGASGTIGSGRVARGEPDGYTMVLGNWATHVLNGPLFKLNYDLQKDFEPAGLVCNDPLIIVVRKDLPPKSLKEFIAWLKANPDKATQGTTGAGGISTAGGLFFKQATQTQFRFVPYKGGLGLAMQDLVAGHIDFMIDTTANSLPQVRAGAIRALAVTSDQRLPAAPEIPTVAEEGLPSLKALNWQAVFLPKGTPKEIVSKVNSAVLVALEDESVKKRLATIGQQIFPADQLTPEALRTRQSEEIKTWWPIIEAAAPK